MGKWQSSSNSSKLPSGKVHPLNQSRPPSCWIPPDCTMCCCLRSHSCNLWGRSMESGRTHGHLPILRLVRCHKRERCRLLHRQPARSSRNWRRSRSRRWYQLQIDQHQFKLRGLATGLWQWGWIGMLQQYLGWHLVSQVVNSILSCKLWRKFPRWKGISLSQCYN
jgi:hypothetical protein